jgi:hypothetical protein
VPSLAAIQNGASGAPEAGRWAALNPKAPRPNHADVKHIQRTKKYLISTSKYRCGRKAYTVYQEIPDFNEQISIPM